MKGKLRLFSANSTELDIYRAVFWIALFLVGFGLVMVFSATYFVSVANSYKPYSAITHQVMWIVIGLFLMVLFSKISPSRLTKLAPVLLLATIAALGAVLVPGVGQSVYGSSRWLGFGSLQVQPSELAKLVLVLFASSLLSRRDSSLPFRQRSLPVLVVAALMSGLIVIEPDLGTSALIGVIAFAVLIGSGTRSKELYLIAGGGVLSAAALAVAKPYRVQRILAFLHPWTNRHTSSYQEVQALAAFATAHLTGVGVGVGQSSYNFVPNAQTDFIFAVIGQNLGLIGALFVLLVFVALVVLLFRASTLATNKMDAVFCYGVAFWVGAQVFLNVGAVEGLLPVTGVPLPLVSAGGSSTVILLVALGLVRGSLAKAVRKNQSGSPRKTTAEVTQ
jgi:cell division protein FtsW